VSIPLDSGQHFGLVLLSSCSGGDRRVEIAEKEAQQKATIVLDPAMKDLLEKIAKDRNGRVRMRSIGQLGKLPSKHMRREAEVE